MSGGNRHEQNVAVLVARLWERMRPVALSRAAVLEYHVAALRRGDDGRPEDAEDAAHKLAGSLGVYGHDAASVIAAEIETIIAADTGADGDVSQLELLVARLRRELDGRLTASH